MRILYAQDIPQRVLAERFGVSRGNVSKIVNERSYR